MFVTVQSKKILSLNEVYSEQRKFWIRIKSPRGLYYEWKGLLNCNLIWDLLRNIFQKFVGGQNAYC